MQSTLTKFEGLLQEHEVIRAELKQILNLSDNFLTLYRLQDNPGQCTAYQINFLNDKRLSLKRAITSLQDGLTNHHQREEEAMRFLVGDPLIQIIKREHCKICQILEDIDWILLNTSPMGLFFNSAFLKQKVDTLGHRLNDICFKEDSVLDLLNAVSES